MDPCFRVSGLVVVVLLDEVAAGHRWAAAALDRSSPLLTVKKDDGDREEPQECERAECHGEAIESLKASVTTTCLALPAGNVSVLQPDVVGDHVHDIAHQPRKSVDPAHHLAAWSPAEHVRAVNAQPETEV